jgi:hypothetical protein
MDFSGFGNNKTFKAGGDPMAPYYYISATLPMEGAVSTGTYYFNADNNLGYAENPDYSRYIILDDSVVISEVVVFSDDDLISATGGTVQLLIGGADKNSLQPYVKVPWAAPPGAAVVPPPGFTGGSLTLDQANSGSVNYFGHEGGHFPYFLNKALPPVQDLSNNYKYLAVTVNPQLLAGSELPLSNNSGRQPRQRRSYPRSLPTGTTAIASGHLTVVLKVYPKTQ